MANFPLFSKPNIFTPASLSNFGIFFLAEIQLQLQYYCVSSGTKINMG
jgi:hypothetical protein